MDLVTVPGADIDPDFRPDIAHALDVNVADLVALHDRGWLQGVPHPDEVRSEMEAVLESARR